ncbi:hypothetical protein [Mycetocola zhadangensis]|uniref:Uncharacterized protein n=1 Tax=Mycetocola zhadangensis TaxID=1164595 RepID=A0A3L7IS90_9MICO|nr:hypothetical protein [Mycetocola zhadangensis]RLQ81076.1 hypothetical protein D9V28_15130 [Mycetocola zhadangensis]GGF04578.1 hypothetical protein GCM10011313_29560 [Mycetocola zhadangensis]
MENDFHSVGAERAHASELLNELESDRNHLAQRLDRARWLAPAFALIAAAYIATPILPGEGGRSLVLVAAIVASVLLLGEYRRVTGVKLSRFGFVEGALFVAAIVTSLFFFSVSLGLAASGLSWWVLASALAGFVVVAGLVNRITASLRERLRDVA